MRKHTKNKTLILPTLLILFGISVGTFILSMRYGNKTEGSTEKHIPVLHESSTEWKNYITETSYNGSEPVDTILFLMPFKKTSSYIMNKDLVNKISKDEIKGLENTASDYIIKTLGTGYHEIENDKDGFNETVSSMLPKDSVITLDDGESVSSKDYAEKLSDYYTGHEIQSDVKFTTADCLTYIDNYYYVRGRLDVTPYHGKSEKTNLLPGGIDITKKASYVVEVSLKPSSDSKSTLVTGVNVLGKIEA